MANDNHMDNYLKENLAFVYYGAIVNNLQKKKKQKKKKKKKNEMRAMHIRGSCKKFCH